LQGDATKARAAYNGISLRLCVLRLGFLQDDVGTGSFQRVKKSDKSPYRKLEIHLSGLRCRHIQTALNSAQRSRRSWKYSKSVSTSVCRR
jgi:hypothetical protein